MSGKFCLAYDAICEALDTVPILDLMSGPLHIGYLVESCVPHDVYRAHDIVK